MENCSSANLWHNFHISELAINISQYFAWDKERKECYHLIVNSEEKTHSFKFIH